MRSRCCPLAAAMLCLAGCGYPTFSFVAGDARDDATGLPDTTTAEVATDTETIDTTVIDTSVVSDGDDATPVDTAADTGVADTAKPDTAKPDMGVDTGLTKGCLGSTHFFCRDFDSVTTPDEGWTSSYVLGSGSITLSGTLVRSAPNAFLSSIGAGTAPETSANVNKALTLGAVTTMVRVDADVYLESGTYAGDGTLLIKIQTPGSGRGVALAVGPPGLYVDMLGTTTKTTVLKPAPANVWFHVRLEATLRITGGTATMYIDDMTKPVLMTTGSTTDAEGLTRNVVVGLYASGTTFAYKARFDDVSVDMVP